MDPKEYFFGKVIESIGRDRHDSIRILDMGCGTAHYAHRILTAYPNATYVGLEPIDASYAQAVKNVAEVPRASVVHQLAYDHIPGLDDASFDVVLSYSVLEHVKHLSSFIALSARYAKPGGVVVHRYDLGHALYSATLKERLHVWLGNTIPWILPERQFVRYVPQSEVEHYFKKFLGTEPHRYTYHQTPGTKKLENMVATYALDPQVYTSLLDWEFSVSPEVGKIPTIQRERIFPTIAVWGRKKGT